MFDHSSKDFTKGTCEECGSPGWLNTSEACLSCTAEFIDSGEFAGLVANLLDELAQERPDGKQKAQGAKS